MNYGRHRRTRRRVLSRRLLSWMDNELLGSNTIADVVSILSERSQRKCAPIGAARKGQAQMPRLWLHDPGELMQ